MKREPLTYVECSLPRTNMTLAEYRRSRRVATPPPSRLGRMVRVVRGTAR